jgi:hypothetical protein
MSKKGREAYTTLPEIPVEKYLSEKWAYNSYCSTCWIMI